MHDLKSGVSADGPPRIVGGQPENAAEEQKREGAAPKREKGKCLRNSNMEGRRSAERGWRGLPLFNSNIL